jgi:hypothetical protein
LIDARLSTMFSAFGTFVLSIGSTQPLRTQRPAM